MDKMVLGPVDVTPKEFRKLTYRLLWFRQMPRTMRWFVPFMIAILVIPEWLRGTFYWMPFLVGLVGAVGFVVLFTVVIQEWQLWKLFRQMPEHFQALRWVLSDEELTVETKRVTLRYKWNEVLDPKQTKDTLLVFLRVRPSCALYMPVRVVSEPEKVLELLRSRVRK